MSESFHWGKERTDGTGGRVIDGPKGRTTGESSESHGSRDTTSDSERHPRSEPEVGEGKGYKVGRSVPLDGIKTQSLIWEGSLGGWGLRVVRGRTPRVTNLTVRIVVGRCTDIVSVGEESAQLRTTNIICRSVHHHTCRPPSMWVRYNDHKNSRGPQMPSAGESPINT